MNQQKRADRARRRCKSMALVKKGVPHTCSKWSLHGKWDGQGLTPGEVMSVRKKARREPAIVAAFRNADGTLDQFIDRGDDDFAYAGAF